MTWTDILALDAPALDRALCAAVDDTLVLPSLRLALAPDDGLPWLYAAVGSTWLALRRWSPATDWRDTLPLARHYGVWSVPRWPRDTPYIGTPVPWTVYSRYHGLEVRTEEEEQLAYARLILEAMMRAPDASIQPGELCMIKEMQIP